MTRDQQRLVDYLAHIIEAIERIDRYTEDMDEAAFSNNPLVQDAVIRNLEVIGEASNNIEKHCSAFALAHPELPLSFAYQMRNAIAHGYFEVDHEIVWKTIHGDLPRLHTLIRRHGPMHSAIKTWIEGMDMNKFPPAAICSAMA